ncbi:MAG: holo-ACP synthase [Desulfatiglandaceae bacterium]|jgi:holo-[acyl-carrier protein] synthase
MIYGIGVDLVKIERMERILGKWGDRFVRRVFSPSEIGICSKRAHPPSAFALRFAAKEAFSKAMGLGMKGGIVWRDIEVFNEPGGKPGLRLSGESARRCTERHITDIHLSLTDEKEYGIAMVVLENSNETGQSL